MTLLLRLVNISLLTGWEQHQHLRSKVEDLLILTKIRVFLILRLFLSHKMTLDISLTQTKSVEIMGNLIKTMVQ